MEKNQPNNNILHSPTTTSRWLSLAHTKTSPVPGQGLAVGAFLLCQLTTTSLPSAPRPRPDPRGYLWVLLWILRFSERAKTLPQPGKGQGKGRRCARWMWLTSLYLALKGLPSRGHSSREADVVALLRAADVLHRDVGHQLVHGTESFVAALLQGCSATGSIHLQMSFLA